jgi:hypothetical protein
MCVVHCVPVFASHLAVMGFEIWVQEAMESFQSCVYIWVCVHVHMCMHDSKAC